MIVVTFVWLALILKIPMLLGGLIVWWAIRSGPKVDGEETSHDDDGGNKPTREPRDDNSPRWPRRGGPHNLPAPEPPARTRRKLRHFPKRAPKHPTP